MTKKEAAFKTAVYQQLWRLMNAEYVNKRAAEWRRNNRQWHRDYSKRYYAEHKDKANPEMYRKRNPQRKFARSNFSDEYVRRSLAHGMKVSPKDLPQELVDAHRELMRLKRELKCATAKS